MLDTTRIHALIAACGLCALPAFAQPTQAQTAQAQTAQAQPAEAEAAEMEAAETPDASESPEAIEARRILERATARIEGLNSIVMRASYQAEGAFSEMFPQMDTTLIAWRTPVAAMPRAFDDGKPNAWDMRVSGTGKRSANAEQAQLDVIRRDWGARATFEWLDHDARQAVRRRDSGARGNDVRLARELIHLDVFNAFPYRRLMRTGTLSMGEPGSLNGVSTVVVRHDPEQGARHTLYHFGAEDMLLRRVEERFSAPGGLEGALILDYSDVRPNAPVAGATREFEIPDGYSEVGLRLDPRRLGREAVPGIDAPAAGEPGVPAQPIIVRRAGLPFSLETPSGETITNESLHGNVTVMGFWATWAPGSDEAGEDIQQMLSDYAELPVAYVGPLVRERRPERAVAWMQENGYDWPILKDANTLAREYGVRKFPTYVMLGFDGEVIGTVEGYSEADTFAEIRTAVDDYLAEKGMADKGAMEPAPAAENDAAEASEGSMGGEG